MLFEEVNKIIQRIKKIEPKKDALAFSNEMICNCATAVDEVRNSPGQEEVKQLVLQAIATGCIVKLIVPLPGKLKQMSKIVKDRSCPLSARCVLAGMLGYLVQPNDLIPDSAKGGYGFVDDAVLVHAAYVEYLRTYQRNASEAQESTELARLAAGICPPQILGPLDSAINGILMGYQLLSQLPAKTLEWTLQQIIANPYQASVQNTISRGVSPQHVEGWTPQVAVRNSLGMTFTAEGGNMMATFPDGGMVIVS